MALGVALLAGAGCTRSSKHVLTEVQATGPTLMDNGLLGLNRAQVEAELRRTLLATGHFAIAEPGSKHDPEKAAAVTLELPFTRESRKEGRAGTFAEVGASLTIRRKMGGVTFRYEVAGLGEVRIENPEGPARTRAMRAALSSALQQVAQAAHLQLAALDKSDADLLRDLRTGDPRVQEFAIRVLAERKNPAVVETLLERLRESEDPEQLRQAMGALAEMREQRAVRPLIDLTRGKDPAFVQEVLFAIAQIGGEEAMAYLFTVAQGHDDPHLRAAAQKALDEIGAREKLRRTRTAEGGTP
ncbi:MAG: HEAT repeat domain-containing protein [Myxococcaceae bacterium]|nr:HEAT repeat domain-containing protein [Myxococcaceae bacterium]